MAPQHDVGAGAEAGLPEYAGHYRLESRLGSGGMGVVHRARSASGMLLAVKIVHAEFAGDPEFRGRFRQEVAAARKVSGAFTAPVVDADPDAERPWMATQFIHGPTLADEVKRNGPLPASQLRRLMAGLAEALRDIHRVGVVHRDLKPSNVLLAEDGPKVIDFGISRPKDSELRTETGKLIGTPPFMAPEQFRRPREVGPAADVFALGSVMVHAATGRGPFDSDSPYVVAYQVVHDEPDLTGVPDNLAPLVRRCLAKRPEDRPTPDELMRELRSVAASYDTQAFIPAPRAGGGEVVSPTGSGSGAGAPAGDGGARSPGSAPDVARDGGTPRDGGSSDDGVASDGVGTSRVGAPLPRGGSRRDGHQDSEETGHRPCLQPRAAGDRTDSASGGGRKHGRHRVLLTAGALGLAVLVTFAGVRLLGTDTSSSGASGSAPSGGAPGGRPWAVRPVADAAGMPRCGYGAGRLVCVQSGQVTGVDAAGGEVLWRRESGAAGGGGETPWLSEGSAHLVTGRKVRALDPATGDVRWERDLAAYRGVGSARGVVLLTGADGTVTAVDSGTGRTAWTTHLTGGTGVLLFARLPGSPWAVGYATSADGLRTRVVVLDAGTGEIRREARLDGVLRPVGASDDSVVFVDASGVYGETTAVVRLATESGRTRRVELAVPLHEAQAGVDDEVVTLLGTGGSLTLVDLRAGEQRWTLETAVSRGSAPVSDGERVYLAGADGRLLAVDAAEGVLLGQTGARLGSFGDRVEATLPSPSIGDGLVLSSAPDGTVFAVDAGAPGSW